MFIFFFKVASAKFDSICNLEKKSLKLNTRALFEETCYQNMGPANEETSANSSLFRGVWRFTREMLSVPSLSGGHNKVPAHRTACQECPSAAPGKRSWCWKQAGQWFHWLQLERLHWEPWLGNPASHRQKGGGCVRGPASMVKRLENAPPEKR